MKKITLLIALEHALTAIKNECEQLELTIVRHQCNLNSPLVHFNRPKTRQEELERAERRLVEQRETFNEILICRNGLKDSVVKEQIQAYKNEAT